MENNNIVTAPQVKDTDIYFEIWRRNHTGSYKVFFDFMTTPSAERDEFINSLGDRVITEFNGAVAAIILNT